MDKHNLSSRDNLPPQARSPIDRLGESIHRGPIRRDLAKGRVGQRTVQFRNGTLSLKTFLLTTSLLILRSSRDRNVHRWWIHWMKLIFQQWKQCNW
ncbi:BQ5605_C026g10255 [Microbotryum silenes-dioicae]|uniref:BQ5605_C026g10255 protein n=1 Tax=Microbotryum silenes-dioicae TaxID=796604 RepID=A0A2X0MRL9_9BASI|nr:BQ5605_C026g10255 [Microbotryum silenes-dioicae]